MVATMIAAAATALATATGVSVAFATFAISFAVSQIVTRIFGEDPQSPQDSGVRQQVPPSSTNAIPVVYGDAYMGGTFVDAVLSTDQKTMYYVLALSSISPNGQFTFDTTKFYYGDRLITFDGTDQTKVVSVTDEAGNVDTKISGNLYINLYKSSVSGTITPLNSSSAPSTVMGGADIAPAQRWASTGRQMNGLAFAIVKLNYNQDAGTTNLSPITFHVSHYLNGAGCAKPGDVWYDYITNTVYGGAIAASFVDSASGTTLNTYSDELITFNNSSGVPSTQPRYRMNGVLDAGQTVLSNIDKIMSCCDSWMTYNAASGQWSVVVNKPESYTYSFNDNNIIGDIRVSATDITSSINQVEAKFPFKDNRDQPSYVQLATPSGLLYPNEPVNKYSTTYDLVNESVQASYLSNRLLEQAREDLIVSFSTTYYGIQVDAGNVVSVTNAAYGWTDKLFRVMKVNEASLPDGSLGAKLELSEYNVQVYDNFDITAFTPAPNSNFPSVSYFSALSAPTVTTSNPSSAIPNFDVTITIPATGRVTSADLFYTTSPIPGPTDWKVLSTATSADGTPFTPGTTYLYENQVLPTGSSTTVAYYFAYVVSNDEAKSAISPISSSFSWTPVAARGPAGTDGLNGLNFINAYRVQNQADATPTFTTPTSGATIPTGWVGTAPSVTVGQVLWYIQGRNNTTASAIDGVAPNTTAWTGPIAASIFQDIRSDNWNGSNPPSAASISTWGTTGYYISRTDGNMYANGFYARGVVKIDGVTYNPGAGVNTALDSNNSTTANYGGLFRAGSSAGIGLYSIADNAGAVAGIYGVSTTAATAVFAVNGAGGNALSVIGPMSMSNSTVVANLNANLVNGLNFGTSPTSGSATGILDLTNKPGTPSSSNSWLPVVISGSTYYIPVWI